MTGKRKTDLRGRNLKDGESQMPDGRYRFRYTDDLGNRQAAYSWKLVSTDRVPEGKRDDISLREKEKKILSDLADGIRYMDAGRTTLNQMFEKYMGTKRNLKDSTKSNYLYMWENYVKDSAIGNKPLVKIKKSDVIRFYNSLLDYGFKSNSLDIINTIVHPTFTMAVDDDIIRKNPSDGVMSLIERTETKPKQALTIKQQEAFLKYIKESEIYAHWLPLFVTFLGTGMRVGELIGLTWKDVDFQKNIISVNHNLIYRKYGDTCEFHITTPKTEKGTREIPMLSDVRKQILAEKEMQMALEKKNKCEIEGYSDFVFTNRFNNPHNPQTINRAIQRIYKAYNEEESKLAEKECRQPILLPHFSVHILRHTFCTRFCENETDVKVIQKIMGHSDISITMNIYAHVTEDQAKEVMKGLDKKMKLMI